VIPSMPTAARVELFCVVLLLSLPSEAQQGPSPLAPYVKEQAPVLVLEHLRVIDGTGAAPQEDMRIEIAGGKITVVESARSPRTYPANVKRLNLAGKTVIPGLVGMHEHLFYPLPQRPEGGVGVYGEAADSAPRLYLAGGVTTARTAGSMEPYTDLALKNAIDEGQMPGPKLDVTSPYLQGPSTFAIQMHQLTGPDDAARMVDYWASEGITSFKAYTYITPEELKAAIDHAHAHGLKITGHLCSVGFKDAAFLGIDNLEHGLVVDTEFYPDKKPGECPGLAANVANMAKNVDALGAQVTEMIHVLVDHHVAITSTLAVIETSVPNRPPMDRENTALAELSLAASKEFLLQRSRIAEHGFPEKALKMEMQFEREFVAAGGLLMAGCDPTGYGGVVPGFGDQRNVELLVEAGFTPLEAIRIATLNGAKFLGKDASIGSIAPGKAADLVILGGNPVENIEGVEKVETVFKDGVGYNPTALIQSVSGLVGLR
jgi:imidazolonepropionase-like amidohydrolase